MDTSTILRSVKRQGDCLIVHDSPEYGRLWSRGSSALVPLMLSVLLL